jgi:hypothetical protein
VPDDREIVLHVWIAIEELVAPAKDENSAKQKNYDGESECNEQGGNTSPQSPPPEESRSFAYETGTEDFNRRLQGVSGIFRCHSRTVHNSLFGGKRGQTCLPRCGILAKLVRDEDHGCMKLRIWDGKIAPLVQMPEACSAAIDVGRHAIHSRRAVDAREHQLRPTASDRLEVIVAAREWSCFGGIRCDLHFRGGAAAQFTTTESAW